MSYRRRPAYGGVRRARPYGRRPVRRSYGRSQYRRAVVPRMRVLSRLPAGLSGGRGATEMKSVDVGGNKTLSFSTAGVTDLVMLPPVNGSSVCQRIGSRIRMVSLEIRGEIETSQGNAAATAQQFARVLVLYDRQSNGSAPSVADVLTDLKNTGLTTDIVTTPAVFCGINQNNRDRFLILRDRKLALAPIGIAGVSGGGASNQMVDLNSEKIIFQEFIKLKGLETHFKASTPAVGDIATGGLIILVVSSADANATPSWRINYGARLKFFD